MSFWNTLFGATRKVDSRNDMPPIYGGDGSSSTDAVVVNCASMAMANHLIDRWLSERHGEMGADWSRGVELFDNSQDVPKFAIRIVTVGVRNGTGCRHYFDVSRPMAGSKNVAKMMGVWPENVD